MRDFVLMEKGPVNSLTSGATHILIDHYSGKRGPVTALEILQLGEVIRGGVLAIEGNKKVYTTTKDGVRFKVVVGVNGKRQTTITFYSNRKSGSRLDNGHSAVLGISPIQTLESAQTEDTLSQGKPEIK